MSRRGYGGSSYRGSGNRGGGGWGDSRPSRGSSRGISGYSGRGGGGGFSPRGNDRSVGGRYWSSGGPPSSFESRSRYPPNPNEPRYSSSSRHDEPSFKRPYRSESSSYGGRDMSGHRSPERKRIRSEVQGDRSPRGLTIPRRESSYADYGANGGHRYESMASGGRYSSERRFSSERRSREFRPPPPREEYRKATRSAPRGSYRGRISTRGLTRREIILSKRRMIDSSFRGPARSSEYLRKLRIAKLRSAAARRIISSRKFRSSRPARREDKKEKYEDDKEDEKSDDKKESDNEETDKLNGTTSPIGDAEEGIDDDKKEEDIIEDKVKEDDSDTGPRSRYTGRRFIRLTCVHCHERCVTFKSYSVHLQRSKHLAAMRRVAIKQKSVLSRMRVLQRSKQRDLDKDDENPSSRKNFCLLCKLNYKQLKSVHQSSEAHKEMKRFLMPFCKTCHITFRSPMLYENHICSLEHIKRKAKGDNDDKNRDGAQSGNEGELNLDNFMTLDSVGDVDDEEGNETDKKSKDGDHEDAEDPETAALRPKKEIVNVGQEHVRKIEVLYCDLCRTYLTSAAHAASEEKRASAMKAHCRSRPHLRKYVRKTEDAALRETAERIHRSNQAKTDVKKEDKKDEDDDGDKEAEDDVLDTSKNSIEDDSTDKIKDEKTATLKEEDGDVDKMWADVDKDLGDLLAEVEPGNKSSDEDEEKTGSERYDRLKTKEKIDTKVSKLDADVKVEKVIIAEEKTVEEEK